MNELMQRRRALMGVRNDDNIVFKWIPSNGLSDLEISSEPFVYTLTPSYLEIGIQPNKAGEAYIGIIPSLEIPSKYKVSLKFSNVAGNNSVTVTSRFGGLNANLNLSPALKRFSLLRAYYNVDPPPSSGKMAIEIEYDGIQEPSVKGFFNDSLIIQPTKAPNASSANHVATANVTYPGTVRIEEILIERV